MAADDPACPERDVLSYPPHMLYVDEARITIGARYRQVWMDGFGARGWKLNSTLDDPEIIASTRETGSGVPWCWPHRAPPSNSPPLCDVVHPTPDPTRITGTRPPDK